MSQFDKLIELIKQNIDKIEFKTVAELFEIKRGDSKYSKEYILENPGDYPVYSSATKYNGEIGKTNTYDYDGEFLTWTTDGVNAGTVFYRNGKFSITNVCGLLLVKKNYQKQINLKFFKYFLNIITKKYVNTSTSHPKLMSNTMASISIVLPPIHIQNQIVDFLSSFSENKNSLIESITKEIELRKQQYNYYHNLLLKENSNKQNSSLIEYKFLSDLFEIKRGNSKYTKEYILENPGDYPVYSAATKNDGELGKINTYDYDGEFLTATLNGDAGHVFYRNGKFSINSDSCVLQAKSNQINIKYFYFLLSHIAIQYRNENGGRPKLPLTNLKEISLPIPPIHIQNQIVEILDEFEQTNAKLNGSLNENVVLTDKQFSTYQKGIINILLDKRERERERDELILIANEIQKWINNFAINKVSINEIFEISSGKEISKNFILENPGDYPVYSSASQNEGLMGMINTFDFDGTYLTVTSRGSLVGTTFYRDGKFSITGSCYAFKLKDNNADKYNLKFLFYFLRNNIKKYGNYSGPIPQLHIKDINEINILVPPIHIQDQIAEILDEFEQTNSNLNKSLNENIVLTDKQFNLYQKGIINILLDKRERERDELIILINYWMQNALYENQEFLVSDLFEIKSGNSKYSKEYILENPGNYPVYSGSIENDGEFGKIDTYDYDGEFLTWTTAGYGGHVFYRNGQFSITGACGLLSIKHNYRHQVNLKFFKFILNNITKEYVTFIKQNYYSLKSSSIAKIPIILPPINIQNKIVEFLSNFDENNNSLINSMDNEIELRKKQFGIYQKSIIDVLLDKRERERERDELIILINYWMQNVSNEPQEFLISDLFDIKRGNSKYTTEYILENPGDYPVYSGSTENDGEIGKINTYDYDGEFLTWTTDGYAGHVFYRNGKFNMNSHCGLLIPKTHNNIKYIKYALNNVARLYVNNDSAIPNLGKDVISNISITLPPIHKQNSVVNLLEKLEENNNNLIDILENQIILISNQYQYYFSKIIKLLIQN